MSEREIERILQECDSEEEAEKAIEEYLTAEIQGRSRQKEAGTRRKKGGKGEKTLRCAEEQKLCFKTLRCALKTLRCALETFRCAREQKLKRRKPLKIRAFRTVRNLRRAS